jgi:hypothetical protein
MVWKATKMTCTLAAYIVAASVIAVASEWYIHAYFSSPRILNCQRLCRLLECIEYNGERRACLTLVEKLIDQ